MSIIMQNINGKQEYLPPVFIENNRIEKIKTILPYIDDLYEKFAKENHFPGYSYGIIVDGVLVHTKSTGFLDLEKKIPITSQSMFRIASMTKSFTALAILKLRDEYKLRLDDPISQYLPDINFPKLTEDFPIVTIRDLLTHFAGYPTDDPWADRKLEETEKDLSNLFLKGVFLSTPSSTSFEYSNLGYTLLGLIINKTSGVPYQQYILENICKPLDMEAYWDYSDVAKDRLVLGYKWNEGHFEEQPLLHDGIFGAMGGLIASLESYSKYLAFHLDAWPARNDPEKGPIKRSTVREMQIPERIRHLYKDPNNFDNSYALCYGYGLSCLKHWDGKFFVGHSGGLPGFGSNWYIAPEYGIGVILFANHTYAHCSKINITVLDELIEKAELKPRQLPVSHALKESQNKLIQLIPDFERQEFFDIFSDNFFKDNPLSLLKSNLKKVFDEAGKIITIEDIDPENQLRGKFIIKCEKKDVEIFFSLTPENPPLIQELTIKILKN